MRIDLVRFIGWIIILAMLGAFWWWLTTMCL